MLELLWTGMLMHVVLWLQPLASQSQPRLCPFNHHFSPQYECPVTKPAKSNLSWVNPIHATSWAGTGGVLRNLSSPFIAHTAPAAKGDHLHPETANMGEIQTAQTWGNRYGAVGGWLEGLTDERSSDGWCCSNSHCKGRKGNKRNRIWLFKEADMLHSCKHLWIPTYVLEHKYWQLLWFFFVYSIKSLPVFRVWNLCCCICEIYVHERQLREY